VWTSHQGHHRHQGEGDGEHDGAARAPEAALLHRQVAAQQSLGQLLLSLLQLRTDLGVDELLRLLLLFRLGRGGGDASLLFGLSDQLVHKGGVVHLLTLQIELGGLLGNGRLLLLGLLSAIAWKPIMAGLEKREQGIADTIAATQAASEDAKKLLASYERRLAEASEEVKAMLDEARRDADNLRQSIVSEARQAADEEKQRAHREIGMARDEAIAQLAETAGDLAVSVAGKFLREKISAEEQQRLVQESVASLKAAPSIN